MPRLLAATITASARSQETHANYGRAEGNRRSIKRPDSASPREPDTRAVQSQRFRDDPLGAKAMSTFRFRGSSCGRVPRRTFLADVGMGFTGLALGAMLHRDGFASDAATWSPPNGLPHFAPKAKSVIWLFMIGGVSHVESFDPKPALTKYGGTSIGETPFKNVLDRKFLDENVRTAAPDQRKILAKLYPLQVGYSKRGASGIEVSDWWPYVGGCVDDLAVIR